MSSGHDAFLKVISISSSAGGLIFKGSRDLGVKGSSDLNTRTLGSLNPYECFRPWKEIPDMFSL